MQSALDAPPRRTIADIALSALALCLAIEAGAAEPPPVPTSPQPVVRAYMKAMQTGDLDAAMARTARIEGLDRATVRRGLAGYSKTLQEQEVETIYHESRATQGCAVVIIEQRRPKFQTRPSILPIMLLLQENEWKVLPKLDATLRKSALNRDQMEEIRVLGKWFVDQVGPIEERSREEWERPLEPSMSALTGAWQTSADDAMQLLRLKADGSFEIVLVLNGRIANNHAGSWSLRDGKVIVLNHETKPSGPSAWRERRVVATTRNILGLAPPDGPRELWRRIPEEAYRKLTSELKRADQ